MLKRTFNGQQLKRAFYLSALLFLAVPAHADWVRRVTDGIMGTRITVELWADDETKANRAIDALLQEMRHIDDTMSTYKPTSEVSQVNARAADGPMKISKELFDLLTTAKEYSVITDGAFDITYASVGYLYFDFRKHIHPNDEQLASCRRSTFCHVLLELRRARRWPNSRRRGCASTWADCCQGLLGGSRHRGIEGARFLDPRLCVRRRRQPHHRGSDSASPWMVGIRDPRKGEGEVITRIPLVDAAISTSGDYERFFEEDGVRYHHIIDPHTGHSASKVRSHSSGPYATRTVGLSKTAFVLGPERAMEIYNRIDDIDAIIVKLDGTVIHSQGY